MANPQLYITDLTARRKAAVSIAQCAFVILVMGGSTIIHLVHGSSWYWPAFGLAFTALFTIGLVSAIKDFRKARTYFVLEDRT